jgi:DNA primase catalytic subunit
MKTLKQYYTDKVLQEMLDAVENSSWHYWTVHYISGKYKASTKRINSIDRLRELLFDRGKDEPKNVYVSIAQFMQPQRVYGKTPTKKQWVIDDTLFLGSDLLFDIDGDTLELAYKDALAIWFFMQDYQLMYTLKDIRITNRGFHLLYHDNQPVKEAHPIKRLQLTQKRREYIISTLPQLNSVDEHHKKIFADQFRVHAAIGSIKASSGLKVTKLTQSEFLLWKKDTRKRQVRSVKADDRGNVNNVVTLINIMRANDTLPIHYPLTYYFIDSRVSGTKNQYITVLKYPTGKKVDIERLQKTYKLSHFFKFQYKKYDMYICFKLVDIRRLIKIMKASKCMNIKSFIFYKHAWIPLSESKDANGKVVWHEPLLSKIILSPYGLQDTHSRPHLNTLDLNGIFKNVAGKLENRLCKAIIKKEVD